jgi:hypothetical protein
MGHQHLSQMSNDHTHELSNDGLIDTHLGIESKERIQEICIGISLLLPLQGYNIYVPRQPRL